MIEIMFIMYVGSCQLMPGGHVNFQLWYIQLIPMLLFMSGLPPILLFKLYQDIYPGKLNQSNESTHHIMSLILMGFLLVYVGEMP